MSWKRLGIGLLLAAFAALNAWVVYEHGYVGFFEQVLANSATVAVLVDLTIALGLVTVWLWGDARDRGVSPLPYVLLTAVFGSVGPLLYLFRREGDEAVPALAVPARAR